LHAFPLECGMSTRDWDLKSSRVPLQIFRISCDIAVSGFLHTKQSVF
jgi:hypothetical protein